MGRGTISAPSPRSQTAEYYVGGREMAGLCVCVYVCVCVCVCVRARVERMHSTREGGIMRFPLNSQTKQPMFNKSVCSNIVIIIILNTTL